MKNRFWTIFVTLFLLCIFVYMHEQFRSVYTWQSGIAHDFNDEMTVVTYNIRYGKGIDGKVDLNRIIDILKEIDADIISLQEVERYSFRSNFYDQANRIASELKMDLLYYPSLAYPGFYYGNIILSRFPIVDSNIIPFFNSGENRTAIMGKLLLPDGEEIYVINTHLGLDKKARLEAIELIKTFLAGIDKPIILTGDLNSTLEMNEYQHWNEYLIKTNQGIALQTFHKEDWQIDYIFHSPHFSVKDVTVFESVASDHFPVVGVLQLVTE
ncbi:endonuclease/exonuclease/phosphatase family protein [Anaerobacillus sp. CMMVII]|uniref:endonuclease/exonuclease/phosphatase family protein n=1 Tax=Anaerobacillus sp. CMMVII TaxID=2755588 RepID=UPI0021B6FD3B|nr:endonuclease/exonuclease/phosphatase family protein [Anaerobacillus sp. CMMVII]MCT8138257.1 endonuclease/exonuclease/phosphatase family protein [Anaerobacillus sp. CMMVII]